MGYYQKLIPGNCEVKVILLHICLSIFIVPAIGREVLGFANGYLSWRNFHKHILTSRHI